MSVKIGYLGFLIATGFQNFLSDIVTFFYLLKSTSGKFVSGMNPGKPDNTLRYILFLFNNSDFFKNRFFKKCNMTKILSVTTVTIRS